MTYFEYLLARQRGYDILTGNPRLTLRQRMNAGVYDEHRRAVQILDRLEKKMGIQK